MRSGQDPLCTRSDPYDMRTSQLGGNEQYGLNPTTAIARLRRIRPGSSSWLKRRERINIGRCARRRSPDNTHPVPSSTSTPLHQADAPFAGNESPKRLTALPCGASSLSGHSSPQFSMIRLQEQVLAGNRGRNMRLILPKGQLLLTSVRSAGPFFFTCVEGRRDDLCVLSVGAGYTPL